MTLGAEPHLLSFEIELLYELAPGLSLAVTDLATFMEVSFDRPPSTELIVMLKDRVANSLPLKCYDELWV